MRTLKGYWENYISAYKGLSPSIWLLAMVMFVNQTGTMILPFLSVYMTTQLGISMQKAGIVLSVYGIGTLAGSWLGGWLTDKFGAYRVQLFSLFAVVPLYLLIPQMQTFESLCLLLLLTSLVKELFRPANSAAISSYAKPENLTRAFSLNRMALNLGFSIGPAIGGFLIMYQFSYLFYTSAIIVFASAVVFWLFFRNREARVVLPEKAKVQLAQPASISAYKDRPFLVFSLMISLYAFCFFQLLNTLPLFYKTEALLSEQRVGLLMAFNGFVVFLLEMIVVKIAENRLSLRKNMVFGTLLCGLAFLILIPSHQLGVLYLSMFIMSISEILIMPFSSTVAVNRSDASNRGSYMGLNSMSYSLAFVTSPFIGMQIVELYGFDTLWTVNVLLIVIASCSFYFLMNKLRKPVVVE